MTTLVSSLDQQNPTQQLGENNHMEYSWSNNIKEKIVQFNYQLVRTSDTNQLNVLKCKLQELLNEISKSQYKKYYLTILFRIACHTRDIVSGKGEYNLYYMQICVWYEFDKIIGGELLRRCVHLKDEQGVDIHPLGSWKDIKYLINYARDYYGNTTNDVIKHSLQLMVNQIYHDAVNVYNQSSESTSLAAKWCPRESSKKFGWIFEKIACLYYHNYMVTAKKSQRKAINKCKMDFRHTISGLNNKLDTPQIKQCNGLWHQINCEALTSITLSKQKIALQNLTKSGEQRSTAPDRISCADNFESFIKDVKEGKKQIKGKRVAIADFVKEALCTPFNETNQTTIETLNLQWENNRSQNKALKNVIAMVDTSGSMEMDNCRPLYNAIGLGIRVSELSKIGKRLLTFSATPSWVNLENCSNFYECVQLVRNTNWGCNTDYNAALKMILDAIVINKLKPEEVENLVLAIFSDMQMDEAEVEGKPTRKISLRKSIEKLYADAGKKLWGKPFKAPHILFWNLRSTTGFPTLSSDENTSMISGFNPAMLNEFCDKGIEALQEYTPWKLLINTLNNSRYTLFF
jgi:hypothetical protein